MQVLVGEIENCKRTRLHQVDVSVFRFHGTYESTPSPKIVMQEYTGHRRSMYILHLLKDFALDAHHGKVWENLPGAGYLTS